VVVADDLPSDSTVTDMIPPTGTVVTYRAVAVSDIESEAYVSVDVETTSRWVFLNYGPGFGSVVRVWGNIEAGRSYSLAKNVRHYAGRPRPVVRSGVAQSESYDLSAVLFAPWAPQDMTSTWDDVKAAVDAPLACVRDPDGTRLFVTASSTDLSNQSKPHRQVTIPLTVIDHAEVTS
jgi:hypothetical protein